MPNVQAVKSLDLCNLCPLNALDGEFLERVNAEKEDQTLI
jgi:hypothetical protein